MVDKLKQAVPLAVAFGVLAFAWIEISLNFSFHWFDNGDLGIGLGLPADFHLVAPAAFITWALFFAAGADMAAATKVAIATVIGATAGLVLMVASPATAVGVAKEKTRECAKQMKGVTAAASTTNVPPR